MRDYIPRIWRCPQCQGFGWPQNVVVDHPYCKDCRDEEGSVVYLLQVTTDCECLGYCEKVAKCSRHDKCYIHWTEFNKGSRNKWHHYSLISLQLKEILALSI